MKEIYNASEIKKNIEPLEKKIIEVSLLESAVNEFNEQLNAGENFIVIRWLYNVIDEQEIHETYQYLETLAPLRAISLRRRFAEVRDRSKI